MSSKRIKLLVTGASGQLGRALKEEVGKHSNIDFIFTSRSELDITNRDSVRDQVNVHKPSIIINTAAYTAVDMAESENTKAFLVNEKGVENIALACKERNIRLIHISTDYVFDGTATVPYRETDPVNPQTVYGKSKLAGEKAIQNSALTEYYIIRTSWLYSLKGNNFYNTMLRLGKEGKKIAVVNDQWGSPTLASNLSKALIHIALTGDATKKGVYHYSGEGACTWYAFAKAILDKHVPNNYFLQPVSTKEYPTAAIRPKYSVLNKSAIKNMFNIEIDDWQKMF
jgi:dTDP-4-dehydrorhamnose reductase